MSNFFREKGSKRILENISFVLLFFLITYSSAFSQVNSDSLLKEPTLQNIIQYALKKQPVVQQALLDETITQLQIKSKLADWYPQVNFNYLYQHNFQVQTNIIGGNPIRFGVDNTSAFQFTASQTHF